MRRGGTVIDRILRDKDTEIIIGKSVYHAAANAPACRAAGHNKRIRTEVDQITGQRCAEESAWMLFWQQNVLFARRDLWHERVTLGGNLHDRGDFVREPPVVEVLFRRDMRIDHRPSAFAKIAEQARDIVHRRPADLAAGGRKFLDRFPEGLR